MSVVADIPFSDHLTSVYVHIDRNASNWIFIGARAVMCVCVCACAEANGRSM
jgi:hypothetical protein